MAVSFGRQPQLDIYSVVFTTSAGRSHQLLPAAIRTAGVSPSMLAGLAQGVRDALNVVPIGGRRQRFGDTVVAMESRLALEPVGDLICPLHLD
jgi:hypothetical protein